MGVIKTNITVDKKLETSQYIKDLSNRWVTFDGQLSLAAVQTIFVRKSERVREILQKVSAQCTANYSWAVKSYPPSG